jgi:hypothetical protein
LKIQVAVFWVVTPRSDVVRYWRFGGSCCLRLHPEGSSRGLRKYFDTVRSRDFTDEAYVLSVHWAQYFQFRAMCTAVDKTIVAKRKTRRCVINLQKNGPISVTRLQSVSELLRLWRSLHKRCSYGNLSRCQ